LRLKNLEAVDASYINRIKKQSVRVRDDFLWLAR
jgi:hypothetical protein